MSLEIRIKEISLELLRLNHSSENKERINKLKESQLGLLFDVLEQRNESFIKLWNRNLELLEGEKIELNVIETGEDLFKSFSKKLFGNITNLGHLNFESKKGGFELLKFQERRYPTQYTGQIDALGRSEVEISKKSFNFTGLTYQVSYVGSITKGGVIKMEIGKTRIKFLGTDSILKMRCFPFFHALEKKNEFFKNREVMLRLAEHLLLRLNKINDLKNTT
jgi:hypothetical protein